MKRIALLATTALAVGYSHGRTETVMVKGSDGPVRVNKADFDADQAEGGDKNYTAYKGKEPTASTGQRSDVNVSGQGEDGEVQTTAAPSAPDFSTGEGVATDPIDPVKNAAAPKSTTSDELLVMKITSGKDKGKFTLVDGGGKRLSDDRVALLKLGNNVFDTEAAAKQMQTHTNPEPAPN